MAGYREFQTGEVLTAANVNDFLMQQSVMVFADASARNTALGTAVGGSNALTEGMVAYLEDDNAVQVYDGTAWASIAGGPEFITGASNTVAIDLSTDSIITRTATGDVTFTGSNYTAGKSATVRLLTGGTTRTLTFPSGWVWASVEPTELLANETGILTVTSFGTVEADVVAAWAWSA